jgi:hypothetical protein
MQVVVVFVRWVHRGFIAHPSPHDIAVQINIYADFGCEAQAGVISLPCACDFPSASRAAPLMLHDCICVPAELLHSMPHQVMRCVSQTRRPCHADACTKVDAQKPAPGRVHCDRYLYVITTAVSNRTCCSFDAGLQGNHPDDLCHVCHRAYPGL